MNVDTLVKTLDAERRCSESLRKERDNLKRQLQEKELIIGMYKTYEEGIRDELFKADGGSMESDKLRIRRLYETKKNNG